MKPRQTPVIINLIKLEHGYQYDSLLEPPMPKPAPKIKRNPPTKNPSSRPSTRLARELSLNSELPSLSQEKPATLGQQSMNQIEEAFQDNRDEEQLDLELKRETQLPESPAKWFSMEQVNQIQRTQLPQFFSGKGYKTPELYVKIRNFIVTLYQKNPIEYLTKTTCRKIIHGDASMIMRVHSFLEKEGIINFGLSVQVQHSFGGSFINKVYDLQHIPQSCIQQVPQTDEPTYDMSMSTDKLTFGVVNKPFSRTFRAFCSECHLICGMFWFVGNQQQTNLCFDCFQKLDPQQKQLYSKFDILEKMNLLASSQEKAEQTKKNNWPIEDNIKLLELASNSGKSWEDVVNAFEGRKNIEDIILQFMQFPIINFAPTEAQVERKQKAKVEYKNEEYLNILNGLYEKSEYAEEIKKKDSQQNGHTIEQETSEMEGEPRQKDNTAKMISLTIEKYDQKIQQYLKMEETIQIARDTILNRISRKRQRVWETEKVDNQEIDAERYNKMSMDDDDEIFPESMNQPIGMDPTHRQIHDEQSFENMLNLGNNSEDENGLMGGH